MPKRVVAGKPFKVFGQEQADECIRLSEEVAQDYVYLTRFSQNPTNTDADCTAKQKIHSDLRVKYGRALAELRRLAREGSEVCEQTLVKLETAAEARAVHREANDSQLAEQSKDYTKMDTLTDIVHVLSARLSELEDHVCIKVNGV